MGETDLDTELRVALVLNGGVSLAVWMSGVVHEIDRLRRARPVSDGEGTHGGRAHPGPAIGHADAFGRSVRSA